MYFYVPLNIWFISKEMPMIFRKKVIFNVKFNERHAKITHTVLYDVLSIRKTINGFFLSVFLLLEQGYKKNDSMGMLCKTLGCTDELQLIWRVLADCGSDLGIAERKKTDRVRRRSALQRRAKRTWKTDSKIRLCKLDIDQNLLFWDATTEEKKKTLPA